MHPVLSRSEPMQLAPWLSHLAASTLDSSTRGLAAFGLSPQVYVTRNFAHTVELTAAASDAFAFLRMADFVLELGGNVFLLLSDREADAVLPLAWALARAAPASGKRPGLGLAWGAATNCPPQGLLLWNWCFCRGEQLAAGAAVVAASPAPTPRASLARDIAIASVQLFNGESPLCPPGSLRLGSLQRILGSPVAKDASRSLPRARGLLHLFTFSSLEDVCVLQRGHSDSGPGFES